MLLYRRDDGEEGEVGYDIDEYIVRQSRHAHSRVTNDSQHDVTGLRDRAERHEALQVFLMDGEKVGNGDRQHDDDHQHILPVLYHWSKDFHQNGAQRKGSSTLRDDTQVTTDIGRSTLIGICRPEVERNQRNLEAQSAEEEHHTHDGHGRGTNVLHDIIKVECARSLEKVAVRMNFAPASAL